MSPSTAAPLVGATFTYTITSASAGGTGTGGVITEVLPGNVGFVSGTAPGGACTENCGTVTCPMGSVSGSATATVTVTANTVGAGLTVAGIAANEWDSNLSNNSATATVTVAAGPSVTSVSPTFIAQKPSGTYTKTLTITGQNFQTGATVTVQNVTCSVTSITATQILCTATVPAASASITPGLRDVTVTPTSGFPGTLQGGLDLRRFADEPSTDLFALDIWKVTTAHNTMYDVVTAGTDGVTTNSDGTQNFNPGGTNYVLRRDMARYVTRARGESKQTSCSSPIFCDVSCADSDWGWIQTFYNDGITAGCGSPSCSPAPGFCPDSSNTRDQMAVFLLKGRYGSTYTPPACAGIFTDVACPSSFATWIEDLYNKGITGGCGTNPLTYCPSNQVTRAQMATFISKTWGY